MRNGAYELVIAPEGYPGKKYRGRYAYEHRVRYWQEHGEVPEVVHHRNHSKRDNAPNNLEGQTRSAHTAHHMEDKPALEVELMCAWCGKKFRRLARKVRERSRKGQTTFCCSQSCGGLVHKRRA